MWIDVDEEKFFFVFAVVHIRLSVYPHRYSRMKVVVQKVSRAQVSVDNTITGSIDRGLVVLAGFHESDTEKELKWMCRKIAGLRIFEDENGKMNRSVKDVGGELLVISQFTLYGNCRKGNRPSFIEAASPETAEPLYNRMVEHLGEITDLKIGTGRFGTMMNVELVNEGPVTLILER